jgi:hypothetical protein
VIKLAARNRTAAALATAVLATALTVYGSQTGSQKEGSMPPARVSAGADRKTTVQSETAMNAFCRAMAVEAAKNGKYPKNLQIYGEPNGVLDVEIENTPKKEYMFVKMSSLHGTINAPVAVEHTVSLSGYLKLKDADMIIKRTYYIDAGYKVLGYRDFSKARDGIMLRR